MLRKKIKNLIRKTAVRMLDMEFDVQDHPNPSAGGTGDFDPNVIPKVVDGSGDTPGPNHKQNIGRTWLSAQMSAGVSPFVIDTRPPNEVVAGMLPGAILMSGQSFLELEHELPKDKELRITIYDQTGEQNSAEVAEQLRAKGWSMARRLDGGYAEWLEFDEPIQIPEHSSSPIQIGDTVDMPKQKGLVMRIEKDSTTPHIRLWTPSDTISERIPISDILNR